MSAPVVTPGETLESRLAAVRSASERGLQRSVEETRNILAHRARLLARPLATSEALDDAIDLLIIGVGGELLAIPITEVVAIARAATIAVLPRAVRPVYGVTAWRGRTLTVLSLAAVQQAVGADTRLVVLGSGTRASLAIVVDVVEDVRSAPRAGIAPAPIGPRTAYTRGMTPDGMLVVDGDALLHPELLAT